MKKCHIWIAIFFISFNTPLQASTGTYLRYKGLPTEVKESVEDYLASHRKEIEKIVYNVTLSCNLSITEISKEMKKVNTPYFYSNILLPIFKNKDIFTPPHAKKKKPITDWYRYLLMKDFAAQMQDYTENNPSKGSATLYTMAQPPVPFTVGEEENSQWFSGKKHLSFKESYDLSQGIYDHFAPKENNYENHKRNHTKKHYATAAGIGIPGFVGAFIMRQWQNAKDIAQKQKEQDKEDILEAYREQGLVFKSNKKKPQRHTTSE